MEITVVIVYTVAIFVAVAAIAVVVREILAQRAYDKRMGR
jgi:hypothetical protein